MNNLDQYGNPFSDLAMNNELLVVGISDSEDGAVVWELVTTSDETQHTSDDGLGMGVARNGNEMIYLDDQVLDNNGVEPGVDYLSPNDYDERVGSSPIGEDRDGGTRESLGHSQVSNEDTPHVEIRLDAGEDDLRNEGGDESAGIQVKNLNC